MNRLLPMAAFVAASLFATTAAAEGGFNFRGGGFFPTADSDFWEETEDAYTFDTSDLNGFIGSVGYTASLSNYFELDVTADFYAASSRSADADFEDEIGNPILHDTRLFVAPFTVGFRVLPAGRFARRGRDGQHRVRHPVFYIGGGVGMAYWQYEEEGDFVFLDPSAPSGFSIFYDRAVDSGMELETHANAGIEFPVSPQWNITLEIRHSWIEATLDENFPSAALTVNDPRELDLGGTSFLVGASLRF